MRGNREATGERKERKLIHRARETRHTMGDRQTERGLEIKRVDV